MKNLNDLNFRPVGTVNDTSLLYKLRHLSSNIHVVGNEFALVYFERDKDGSFKPPKIAPDLDKMKVSILVENTFKGATIFAVDNRGRIRETKADIIQGKWTERCKIGFGGTVLRMDEGGKVEVYDVTLVKQSGKVFIDYNNFLEILLPINNDPLLNARIEKYDILEQFRQKLKAAIEGLRNTEETNKTPPPSEVPEEKAPEKEEKESKPEKKTPAKKTAKTIKKEKVPKKVDESDVTEFVKVNGEQSQQNLGSASLVANLHLEKFKKTRPS